MRQSAFGGSCFSDPPDRENPAGSQKQGPAYATRLRLVERVRVMADQELLGVEVLGSVWWPLVTAGRIEHHRAVDVAQVRAQHDVAQVLEDLGIANRHQDFDTPIQV